jgi:hypothetical protein
MLNFTVTEGSDERPHYRYHEANRMNCELDDCVNSNKKKHKEIPDKTDDCEDELSTRTEGGNPNSDIDVKISR